MATEVWEGSSRDAAGTEALGRRLAAGLRAGDWVALRGSLGAGKTTLVRGLAAGLGIGDPICSPTYLLLHEHPGPVPLLHLDAWFSERLESLLLEGLAERLADPGAVVVVEWAERIAPWLPARRLDVELVAVPGGRRIRVRPLGPGWAGRWPALRARLEATGGPGPEEGR